MKKQRQVINLLIITIFMSLSCIDNTSSSAINEIFIDTVLVKSIRSNYDSSSLELKEENSIFHYYRSGELEDIVVEDERKNIVAVVRRKRGVNYFAGEYYRNGQLKGSISYNSEGEVDGRAIYYYSDGRIKNSGFWKNGKQDGIWKSYTSEGVFFLEDIFENGRKKNN